MSKLDGVVRKQVLLEPWMDDLVALYAQKISNRKKRGKEYYGFSQMVRLFIIKGILSVKPGLKDELFMKGYATLSYTARKKSEQLLEELNKKGAKNAK